MAKRQLSNFIALAHALLGRRMRKTWMENSLTPKRTVPSRLLKALITHYRMSHRFSRSLNVTRYRLATLKRLIRTQLAHGAEECTKMTALTTRWTKMVLRPGRIPRLSAFSTCSISYLRSGQRRKSVIILVAPVIISCRSRGAVITRHRKFRNTGGTRKNISWKLTRKRRLAMINLLANHPLLRRKNLTSIVPTLTVFSTQLIGDALNYGEQVTVTTGAPGMDRNSPNYRTLIRYALRVNPALNFLSRRKSPSYL